MPNVKKIINNELIGTIDHPPKTVFSTMNQCASKTGIAKELLRLMKKNGAPGFNGSSAIYWDIVKPYYLQHKDTLQIVKLDNNNTKALKDEGIKLDNDLKRLQKKKLQLEYLDPKDVSTFLLKLRLSFESVVSGWSTELPVKFVGKSQADIEFELKNQISILLTSFGEQIREKMNECSTRK